jgi:hypothetical protein
VLTQVIRHRQMKTPQQIKLLPYATRPFLLLCCGVSSALSRCISFLFPEPCPVICALFVCVPHRIAAVRHSRKHAFPQWKCPAYQKVGK